MFISATSVVLIGGGADCDWALSNETNPPSWHFTVRMTAWMPAGVVAEC